MNVGREGGGGEGIRRYPLSKEIFICWTAYAPQKHGLEDDKGRIGYKQGETQEINTGYMVTITNLQA